LEKNTFISPRLSLCISYTLLAIIVRIRDLNGDVYTYAASKLRDVTGDVVGWDSAPAYTVCAGIPDTQGGGQTWNDIITISAKSTGIPTPICTDADGNGYFA
jgi:hypothetical protein